MPLFAHHNQAHTNYNSSIVLTGLIITLSIICIHTLVKIRNNNED